MGPVLRGDRVKADKKASSSLLSLYQCSRDPLTQLLPPPKLIFLKENFLSRILGVSPRKKKRGVFLQSNFGKMKIEIVDEGLADLGATGRIKEVEDGQDVDTCFICNEAPDQELAVEGRSDLKFCSEDHRSLHEDDAGNHYPFFVQFKPEVGRLVLANCFSSNRINTTSFFQGIWWLRGTLSPVN